MNAAAGDIVEAKLLGAWKKRVATRERIKAKKKAALARKRASAAAARVIFWWEKEGML